MLKTMYAICALSLLSIALFAPSIAGEEASAMDYIIKANVGKEDQMNVDKFDIRLPPFVSGATGDEQSAAARDETRLWPNGVVPYVVDMSLRLRPLYTTNLKKALKEWMTYTCLKFREKKATDTDYVVFGYGIGCNADVGRKGEGQFVTLGKGCSDTSVIIHEIGHVVGFWHEQNRPDRNKYVDIIWDNIIDDYEFAFSKYTERRINSHNISYDYKSIMHYGNKAFAKDKRKPTIVAKNGGTSEFGNLHLSPLDIKQTKILYKCPALETLYPKFPQDFAFLKKASPSNKQCVLINESRKRKQKPMWLCSKKTNKDPGIHWSDNGKIPHMDCTHISSPFGDDRHRLWNNNYLCVVNDSIYKFYWVKYRPIAGLGCMKWPSSNGESRRRMFLCAKTSTAPIDGRWSGWSSWTQCNKKCGGGYQEMRRYCTNPEPKRYGKPCYGVDYKKRFCNLQQCEEFPIWPNDFLFSYFSHTPYEKNCMRINDQSNELYWRNYYFCSVGTKRRIRARWSDMGPQPGMICKKIDEPEEEDGWDSNYLCVSPQSSYRFEWSHAGPIAGLQCIQWLAKNGTDGWNDNYLCGRKIQPPVNILSKQGGSRVGMVQADVNGGWSKWQEWSGCSKSCDAGYKKRSRSCTEPTPSRRGKPCPGRGKDIRFCKIKDCPKPCNTAYVEDSGRLSSPNFPKYPQNSTCRWRITVSEGKRVEMKFTFMKIQARGSTCSSDSVIVRDGGSLRSSLLKKFCHNLRTHELVYSTGNTVFIELRTSNVLMDGGFTVNWNAKPIPKKATCGGTLTGLSGAFTSPLYPNNYPNNKECEWLIEVPLDRLLRVTFEDFALEPHTKCRYDKVDIFDGGTSATPKKSYCGKNKPGVFTAFTNRVLIKFKSDRTRTHRGFKAHWSTTIRSLT